MIYSICDFLVEYEPKYSRLRDRSEKYLNSDQNATADFSLEISDEAIDNHIASYPMSRELAEYVVAGIEFYDKIIDKGAFFLHSSAVGVRNCAYAFTGPCGAGKSTHSRMWKNVVRPDIFVQINDDKPAVRIIDDVVYICGTPFSGKHDINANVKLPLCGISILSQSPDNSIERITAGKALPILLEQTLRPADPRKMLKLMEMMDEVLKKVPVYAFACNISKEAVELAYYTMTPEEFIVNKRG